MYEIFNQLKKNSKKKERHYAPFRPGRLAQVGARDLVEGILAYSWGKPA